MQCSFLSNQASSVAVKAKSSYSQCPAPAAVGNMAHLGSAITVSVATVLEREAQLGLQMLTHSPCSWESDGIQGKDQPASNLLIKTPIGLEESYSGLRTAQRQAVPNHRTAYHRKRRRGKCNSLLGVQINGSQRAILPASPHTLPANCQENWQEREKDRAEDYLQAPILKLKNRSTWLLGLLHTEPTRGQNAV